MADPVPFEFGFPVGGVVKATAVADQPQLTTPSALNVWAYQYPDGRMRGGVRPGLSSASFPGSTPYNWCQATWVGGDGIAVTTAGGTYISEDGNSWGSPHIATDPLSDFSSCAVMNGTLFQASVNKQFVRYRGLATGAEANLTATAGTVPTYCGLVYAHAGRLFLGGDKNNPHVLYASAVNDFFDWDYALADEGAAWASSGVSGAINRPINGILSHGNGCLLVGHLDAITVIRDDPQLGGAIEEIDQYAGPIMQSAWCKTGSDDTAILTREELSFMPPGCGAPRVSMSRFKLPKELAAINPSGGDTASVGYDGRFNGLNVLVRRKVDTDVYEFSQFFFDLAHKGFHPMAFASGEFRLAVTISRLMSRTRGSSILLKSGGGSYYNTSSTESISSHVVIGPIPMGNAILDGIMTRFAAVLTEDSDPVDFEIYAGSSEQEALNGPVRYSGTLTRQGLNYSFHPRVVGHSAWVKLLASGTTRWAIEKIVGETFPKRRRRVMHDAP